MPIPSYEIVFAGDNEGVRKLTTWFMLNEKIGCITFEGCIEERQPGLKQSFP